MQRRFILPAFLIFAACVTAQPGSEVQNQLEMLKDRVKALEQGHQSIRNASRSADSLEYAQARLLIFEAYSGITALDREFRGTHEKIALTGLFTKMMQANNPTSDVLGFRFTDIVMAAAEQHFASTLKQEPDKKRFLQIVSRILEHPIVDAVTGSNPLTSVVSAIISSVINFSTVSAAENQDGGKSRSMTVSQQEAFSSASIREFQNDLQVYITFYDKLLSLSEDYLAGLKAVDRKYDYLVGQVSYISNEFSSSLEGRGPNPLAGLASMLPEPATPGLDFRGLTSAPAFNRALDLAARFPAVKESVDYLKKDYQHLLASFLSGYIQVLRSAGHLPEGSISQSKTADLVREIETYMSDFGND